MTSETPSADTGPTEKQRAKRQPLYLRMYFEAAMVDLVRLVGYQGFPVPSAQQKLKPLIEKYGRPIIEEATDEIVEFDRSCEPPVARLTAQARKLAFQLLGPPPESRVADEKPTASQEKSDGKRETGREEQPPDAEEASGTNVRLPRREVLDQYLQWLQREKPTFLVAHEAQRKISGQARLATLDFVVHQHGQKLLVTVRSSLRAKERADMLGWQEAFDPEYAAVRVWPVEGKGSWIWKQYAIENPRKKKIPPAGSNVTTTDASDRAGADAPGKGEQPSGSSNVAELMQQYREAKERHPGMLLLFRMGDFYELFSEDAETAAKLLGLTLTTRDRTISMAGFPHHSLENYLSKLLRAGQRVAICEQVTETLPTKPIRATRVVTPGTVGVEAPAPADIPSQEHEFPSDPDQSARPDPPTPVQPRPHAPARKQSIARKRQ